MIIPTVFGNERFHYYEPGERYFHAIIKLEFYKTTHVLAVEDELDLCAAWIISTRPCREFPEYRPQDKTLRSEYNNLNDCY